MVHTCVIRSCRNRASSGGSRGFFCIPTIRYHEGPKTEALSRARREKWLAAINRENFVPSQHARHARVCGDHFLEGEKAYLHLNTSPSWVPSLNLGYSSTAPSVSALNRSTRLFAFPTTKSDNKSREKWKSLVNRLGRNGKLWSPSKDCRVCSDHFIDGKPTPDHPYPTERLGYQDAIQRTKRILFWEKTGPAKRSKRNQGRPSALYSTESPDWAPTQNLGHNLVKARSHRDAARHARFQKRRRKKIVPAVTSASEGSLCDVKQDPLLLENELPGHPSTMCSEESPGPPPNVTAQASTDSLEMPFSYVMPVSLPMETQVPALPVDLGLVKEEPPDPVPTGLYTSVLKVNQPADQTTSSSVQESFYSGDQSNLLTDEVDIDSGGIGTTCSAEDSAPSFVQDHLYSDMFNTSIVGSADAVEMSKAFVSQSNTDSVDAVLNSFPVAKRKPSSQVTTLFLEDILKGKKSRPNPSGQVKTLLVGDILTSKKSCPKPSNQVTTTCMYVTMNKSCQTRVTMERFSELESATLAIEAQFRRACSDLSNLHKRLLDTDLSDEALANNSEKVLFYTGLANFKSLKNIESFLKTPHLPGVAKSKGFLITLIVLKLNISFADLACRFQVEERLVSEIIDKWQKVMDDRLKSVLAWPSREKLRQTVPENLKNFFGRQIAMIIDCFEVLVNERFILPQLSSSSFHRGEKTQKFLLGIAPSGLITFVSEALSSDRSYRDLIQKCNFSMCLLPGDVILANWNSSSWTNEPSYCAEVVSPEPATCEPLLNELDENRRNQLADLWGTVEEVTGRLKKSYEILQGTMGWTAARTVRVCAALSNITLSGMQTDRLDQY